MGLFFCPKYNFIQGKPFESGLIKTSRTAGEVLDILRKAKSAGIELSIISHLRGLDGCGSSLDLPEFQKRLTGPEIKNIDEIPCTTAIASHLITKIRFELSDDENAIEYIASDYGITEDNPFVVRENIKLNRQNKTENKQLDGPSYIFRNIFGLKGIKIILEETSPLVVAGGMEASNTFNISLIAAASMFSGANLSQADIFSLAVKLENDEFGGMTGGQGHLSCLLGGIYKHTWMSGVKDKKGNFIYPYSVFSSSLSSEDRYRSLEEHMAFVQVGKDFEGGKQKINRTAVMINDMWTDLLRDEDEVGLPLHEEKIELAHKYADAIKKLDFEIIVELLNKYVDIRDQLCLRWINLALDAYEGKPVPLYAHNYKQKIFDKNRPDRENYNILNKLYQERGNNLRKVSLYSLDPIAPFVKTARGQKIAIMPLGAGGPGSNLIAVSSKGMGHLKEFLESYKLEKMTEESCRTIIKGTGTLRGYLPFKVGGTPIQFIGFGEIGLSLPPLPRIFQEARSYPWIMPE